MACIQSIPVELLIRILTIDYEDFHLSYICISLNIIVLISLVCQHWHEITLDGENFYFRITNLRLGFHHLSPVDTAVEAAAFRRCLVHSKTSDIDVSVKVIGGTLIMDQQRIYAHMLLMPKEHTHQIVDLSLQYDDLSFGRFLISFMNMLGRAPRL